MAQQQDECTPCLQIGFATILGSKIVENRDKNIYKSALQSKVAFNFPLGMIFAIIWSDFGVQIFSLFRFSELAVCLKFGFRDKVAPGKPLGVILEQLLVDFLFSFGCFWNILWAFRDGQADS